MNEKNKKEDYSLEALKAGDRNEFAKLVDDYSAVIYRLAVKMLENPQDAEDVLQETFIKAYKHLKNFDGRSSISTWLYRIATNEALMMLRKRKYISVSIDEPIGASEDDQEPLQIIDWCCLPETELMSSEALDYLDEAVENLPYSLRVVFLLRDIDGLSTKETSEVLNLSESAVKTRLSRARMRLRELLSEYFGSKIATRHELKGNEA
jgi:RNA polymerase sigma-70 factor, ECF subfamily